MKKVFLSVGAVGFLFLVAAGAEASTNYTGTVSTMQTYGGVQAMAIALNNVPSPCQQCGGGYSIGGTDPNYKEDVAMLMQALASGKTVTLVSDNTCGTCRANVTSVILSQ